MAMVAEDSRMFAEAGESGSVTAVVGFDVTTKALILSIH